MSLGSKLLKPGALWGSSQWQSVVGGLGRLRRLEGYTRTSQFSTPRSNCAWPSGPTETPPLLPPSALLLFLLVTPPVSCLPVLLRFYQPLSHYSNTWEPRCHTCSARGFTCGRATGDEEKHIRRERLGPGATLRSGGDTRFSYTSEVWGGGGGLLRTWNSLATITSRRPACTRLSGLKRKQPSVLCPSACGRLQHDGFANASTTGSVQTRLSAPWVPKLGRAGSGRSDSEHL